MAKISEQSIEQVRQAADIIEVVSNYVELKQRGRNFFGLCPFHNEKTPSFSVNPEKQIYKCFGCGSGGGAINFIMGIENLEFPDAIKHLAQSFNIVLDIKGGDSKKFADTKSQLLAIHQITTNYYQKILKTENGEKALNYLKERGLSEKIIDDFKIGFSPNSRNDLLKILRDESFSAEAMKLSGLFIQSEKGYFNRFRSRIMFPIQNYKGDVIAFGGRIFNNDDPAKYQNSPETPIYNKSNVLYGLNQNSQYIRDKKNIILVEGYMDLLQITQAGFNNCLAISGTAFTEGHAAILKRYSSDIYVTFDGDDAGRKASLKCGYILTSNSMQASIVTPPNQMDPDDWIREKGNEEFEQGLSESNDLISSHYNYFSDNNKEGSLNVNKFIEECLNEIINIQNPITKEILVKRVSELTSIDQNNILLVLNDMTEKRMRLKKIREKQVATPVIIDSGPSMILYDDLIRLCFAEDKKIREFIFTYLNKDWIVSDIYNEIYEQLYIHLKGDEAPPISIVSEQISTDSIRQKLIDLTFDLDKFEPTYDMAVDCVIRIEQNILKNNIAQLREKLKDIDEEIDDSILNQLANLEKNVQEIKNKYNED